MKHFAVFGYPIAHSLSPQIHTQFAAQFGEQIQYTREEATPQDFPDKVRSFFAEGGIGCNVTAPHKLTALNLAECVSTRAQAAGAANTLWCEGGKLYADNTDGIGYIKDVQQQGLPVTGARILVLGAGGAARGILGPLLEARPRKLTLVNRNLSRAQELSALFPTQAIHVVSLPQLTGEFDLIVNATAAQTGGSPLNLPHTLLCNQPALYDLSYTSLRHQTDFLRWGQAQECKQCSDGLGMLIHQAAESYFIWTGLYPETQHIKIIKN